MQHKLLLNLNNKHRLPFLFMLLLLTWGIHTDVIQIMKMHDYRGTYFDSQHDLLAFPLKISIGLYPSTASSSAPSSVQSYTFKVVLSNMTDNFKPITPIPSSYQFPSIKYNDTCQYILESLDYAIYHKLPFIRIKAVCTKVGVRQIAYTMKIYRAGVGEIVVGQQEVLVGNLESMGKVRASVYYRFGDATPTVFSYALYLDSINNNRSIYRVYPIDSKIATVYTMQALQKMLGFSNLNLLDIYPSAGPDGNYTLYLSSNYGLVINYNSKPAHNFYNIPFKPQNGRIVRICWSDIFAVKADNSIYILNLTFNANNQSSKIELLKTIKIPTSQCELVNIGQYAICVQYSNISRVTTWHVVMVDVGKSIGYYARKFNSSEYTERVFPIVCQVQYLCGSDSFFMGNGRYQIFYNYASMSTRTTTTTTDAMPTETDADEHSITAIKTQIVQRMNIISSSNNNNNSYGEVLNFIDYGQSILVVSHNQTAQKLYVSTYEKSVFDGRPTLVTSYPVHQLLSTPVIQYDHVDNTPLCNIFIIFTHRNNNSTPTTIKTRFMQLNRTFSSPNFYNIRQFALPIAISDIGYFKNVVAFNSSSSMPSPSPSYYFIGRTAIQSNAYAKLILNYSAQQVYVRYGYEVQSQGFRVCSVYEGNDRNYAIMFREGQQQLVAIKAVLKKRSELVFDDMFRFPQYKQYKAQCANDGLYLYNSQQKHIVLLNKNLLLVANLRDIYFQELKFTKSLLLIKNGVFVEVRSQGSNKLFGMYQWSLTDLVSNVRVNGFVHKKEGKYYEFVGEEKDSLMGKEVDKNLYKMRLIINQIKSKHSSKFSEKVLL